MMNNYSENTIMLFRKHGCKKYTLYLTPSCIDDIKYLRKYLFDYDNLDFSISIALCLSYLRYCIEGKNNE